MEACLAVEKEIDKVLSKFGGINEHAKRVLSDLVNQIQNLKEEYDNTDGDYVLSSVQRDILKQSMGKIKDTVSKIATDHRDLHSTVSKVGKAIDRNFVSDFAATTREDSLTSPEKLQLINKIICQHLYRQGMQDVADELAKECEVMPEAHEKEPLNEVNHILERLKVKDLEPALAWAVVHRDNLEAQNSPLEFMLHRLKFIELLRKGVSHQTDAISYARTHFRKFVHRHEKDIQTMMGMLLYIPNGINSSPYSCLLDSEMWIEIHELFIREACQLLGVCVNSPLTTCINAGCTAVPALLNIKHVMMQRQVTGIWNGREELPIEIDLGSEARYHSVFACPILRQQSTKFNPPMRLVCGHVISRDALNKLCSGNKMKCPYCPMEQTPADARLIFF
ncbi:required for meiotic nuclear division 5 protein souji [Leptinotarsa decemlineata]|uniref:required for meiotic nuclear division 5 protein souji n=1 Tax=Leptinotarsa decemlineata TaxID=7539 RepID=UPI000C2545E0|nr:protein RMD5 homolog A [Leptinotarsa decemlineata]